MAEISIVKISALPVAEQIGDEDLLALAQDGATKALAYGTIKDDISEELAPDATLSEAGKAADAKAVGDALALKSDVTAVTAEVSRIDTALNTKVNNTTYTAEVERIDSAIATKADAAATTAALATKANINDVNAALALKADTATVDAALMLKADKTELTAGLATKQNVLTFDSTPTENSTNPVTSGGVWEAIQTDKTLTVEDKAADAKKTGVEINYLKSALGNINGSQVKTKQVDYSNFTISENKKITGYDTTTHVPLLADESGSFVADIAISDLAQYLTIKFPRCSKSSQWFIIYSDSQAWNFLKTSHTQSKNYDLSNDDYGIINCKWLASMSYTRIVIASDNAVDITVDSQFDTFFDLMDSVKKNDSASVDIRKLYYADTIDITKQATNTYVPFLINSGETLTFTNNTSGNVALNAIDASNNSVLITSGVTAGQSVTFTAAQDFIQILYWAQQLGSVSVATTDAVIYQLENAIKNSDIASVNMFGSIAAIGDSYTAGSTKNSAGTWVDYRNLSWIATMGKRSGTDWKNYGHGGATTKSFLETAEFANALSDTACDLYFFALGQNDGNQGLAIGTVADIHDSDYTQNADTFYGNYGRIIQQIKNHAPKAKLVMIKNWVQGATWTDYDTAIEGIATHYNIPCIDPFDDYFFNSALYQNYKEYGHPTAMGYSSMGLAMERLFSQCVAANPTYFKFSTIG